MSKNFEVLHRIEQEQETIENESPLDVSTLLNVKCAHTSEFKASNPADAEILKLVHVLFLSTTNAPHYVLFCGVDTDEGSKNVSMSAAKVLANEVSTRVCLVDAKSSGGTQDRSLDFDEHSGSVARQIGPNLWSVPLDSLGSVGIPNRGTVQICSGLLDLRKEFGYVLVDAPPLGADTIASVLGQAMDGVVLVLEANSTRRITARSAKHILEAARVRLLGVVLNNRTFPIPEKLYRRL